MKNRIFSFIISFFALLLVLLGICIYMYPLASGYVAEQNFNAAIENFENLKQINSDITDDGSSENVDDSGASKKINEYKREQLDALYEDMQKYNADIYKDGQSGLCDAWAYEQSEINLSQYGVDGAVGVLRIPAMNDLKMPIYLGASSGNMAMGAAQLGKTSMPIGGNNTNCVLAGHRGWSGASYFLYIEQLAIGDMVYIDNLWTTLTYKVSEIKIIEPSDIDSVLIQENKDMVTLITCHPYWASTYRYAVFCERADESSQNTQTEKTENTAQTDSEIYSDTDAPASSQTLINFERSSYIICPALIITLALLLIKRKKYK